MTKNELRMTIISTYFTLLALLVILFSLFTTRTYAQTVDPNTWQQGATGLKLQSISVLKGDNTSVVEKKTSGLSISVMDKGWPKLGLQGGIQDTGYGKNTGPIGIDLGLIKNNLSGTPSVSGESVDWNHNELTFTPIGSDQLKVTISRSSSAALIQSNSNLLRLLAGPVNSFVDYNSTLLNFKEAPSYPKYIAYSSGGTIQVKPLSTASLILPPLDNNWILVWYGTNSHFYDSKVPIPYPFPMQRGCCQNFTTTSNKADAYQADAPLLITFQNSPNAIVQTAEGGIDLNFASNPGFASVLPVLGRDHPKASTTETWGTSNALPQTIKDKINFWSQRLCQYPTTVAESYSYNSPTDTATITDNITFLPVCSFSSIKFAQVAPMLAVAKDSFGSNFSWSPTNLVNANLPTEFGPTYGFDNVSSYSWNLKGLNKYTTTQQVTGSGVIPPELTNKLKSEADKIITDGHYAPWLFNDRYHNTDVGDAYWFNPADTIYQLTQIIPVLPEPQKTNLTNYLKTERSAYPPETVYQLALNQGKERGFYSLPASGSSGSGSITSRWSNLRTDLFYSRVPLYNFYSLDHYYNLTGEAVSASVMSAGKTALNNDMKEQDFATFYWFKGFPETRKKRVVQMANKHFQGLVGLTNLSKKASDTTTENLTRALLAKEVVFKIASAKYPTYLYNSGLTTLPTDPAWQPKTLAGIWNGQFLNYNWTTPQDDARQVMYLNQFELQLFELNGYMEPYTGFGLDWVTDGLTGTKLAMVNTIPEIWNLLNDYAKTETETYIKKVEAIMPNWYVAFGDSVLGSEHNLNHPDDSYNIFMGKVYLQKESAQNLEKYVDIPWLQSGDLFYIQKLAETAKAYTSTGSSSPLPSASITPTKVGDIVINNKVDIFDYNALLTDFGKKNDPNTPADLDNDNDVDIFDYNLLLTNFGS